jgi:hypothetical protein
LHEPETIGGVVATRNIGFQEVQMDKTVDVTIPVEPEVAAVLKKIPHPESL